MNIAPENEDIDFEPEDELGSVGAAKAKMQKLRDELEKVKAERQEYLDGWQRAKADSVNSRKDALAQAERYTEQKIESFVEDILPALDSFDMAASSGAWASVPDGFRTGMEQVRAQLIDALRRNGIERFANVGDQYSPRIHEIVQGSDDVVGEPGSIVRVVRFGYRSSHRVIRPAQVIIGK